MAINKGFWGYLPNEILLEIIRVFPTVGGKCSQLAPVCRLWQSILEPVNFAEISLTVPRLEDPESQGILFRKRNLIRYIWFRVELKEYDCMLCTTDDINLWGMDDVDNQFIADAFQSLFTTMSAWEPRGDLVLDISVYSPSDNKHWFKYLTFCSDTDFAESPPEDELHDPAHGWTGGRQFKDPPIDAVERTFDEIMGAGPFDAEPPEMEWWRSLPLVPAVGVVLLRQQTRRRWKPTALANMLTRLPNMKDLFYEPWRDWCDIIEIETDGRTATLIESFASTRLCNLTIFENFNEVYPEVYCRSYWPVPALRVPDPYVSEKLARASLHLTTLSASFMIDASHFFKACRDSWTWNKLTSLALTSGTLTKDTKPDDVNKMLHNAADAALQMPKLDTMEIWNGRRGVAMAFRYQRARDGKSAAITVRGTWELKLSAAVTRAWSAVAHSEVVVQRSLIDVDKIRSHGDAICELGLSAEVVRPVSLQQILIENRFQA
ncbi:hypothetical protein NW768_004136 [Fusarium equiseti]|uniref:DUF6546 domain-containing protein n=1 Tax=Fusarium equiseti TaxID=61235 RepID=A0ABQ8RJK9_FUSEQ|nr:hypothetical protein NW768_004136 [Fusarium equiseti]